jgi:polysaccharide export outer membrane protein
MRSTTLHLSGSLLACLLALISAANLGCLGPQFGEPSFEATHGLLRPRAPVAAPAADATLFETVRGSLKPGAGEHAAGGVKQVSYTPAETIPSMPSVASIPVEGGVESGPCCLPSVDNTHGCFQKMALRRRPANVPRELEPLDMPPYVIQPPDILLIDALRVVPLPPYRIEPLDVLLIQVPEALPKEPISGMFPVESEGRVNLGVSYGTVNVVGLTIDEARAAVEKHLKAVLNNPKALVALAQSRAMQQIRGEHLVRPDGSVGLGLYGSVPINGLTLEQAKAAIENHLAQFMLRPEVSVDVFSYNSKVYYVVLDGGGYGEQVIRLPFTGNETVLDALAQVNGLPAVASKKHIWVARPTPGDTCGRQLLPVHWGEIVQCGLTATNYHVLPNDRIYVKADALIRFDNMLAKIIAPIERVLGVSLLAQSTILEYQTRPNRNGTNGTTNNGVIP